MAGIPSEPNVYYMGTAGGGVWKTDDYGHSWKNISDKDFKTSNIGAMAIAPSDSNVIYVGTGDSGPRNTVLIDEGGMYKSTDGGKTWHLVGLEATHIISWILVDPRRGARPSLRAQSRPRGVQDHRRWEVLEKDPVRG